MTLKCQIFSRDNYVYDCKTTSSLFLFLHLTNFSALEKPDNFSSTFDPKNSSLKSSQTVQLEISWRDRKCDSESRNNFFPVLFKVGQTPWMMSIQFSPPPSPRFIIFHAVCLAWVHTSESASVCSVFSSLAVVWRERFHEMQVPSPWR